MADESTDTSSIVMPSPQDKTPQPRSEEKSAKKNEIIKKIEGLASNLCTKFSIVGGLRRDLNERLSKVADILEGKKPYTVVLAALALSYEYEAKMPKKQINKEIGKMLEFCDISKKTVDRAIKEIKDQIIHESQSLRFDN